MPLATGTAVRPSFAGRFTAHARGRGTELVIGLDAAITGAAVDSAGAYSLATKVCQAGRIGRLWRSMTVARAASISSEYQ